MRKGVIYFILLVTLLIGGCGGEDSRENNTSSFNISNDEPIAYYIATFDGANINSTIEEKNEEYTIYINENQNIHFKIMTTNNNQVLYGLSKGDWELFNMDKYTGEFFFKEPTDYEKKTIYRFNIVIDDGLGYIIEKKVTIHIKDIKDEIVESTVPIVIDDESKYFITTWKTDNEGISDSNQITIPTTGDGYNYSVDWGDGEKSENITQDITHSYAEVGEYTIKISGDFPRIYFKKEYEGSYKSINNYLETIHSDSKKLISIKQWGDIKWTSMSGAFYDCSNLVGYVSDVPNLYNVTDMSQMFVDASQFNQDIGEWNVSTVTNMKGMFYDAELFNRDIGRWNVSNVTSMNNMFWNAKSFNQNISNWDVSNVSDMRGMFSHANLFNQSIGKWNISSVTSMGFMFWYAESFNQNISDWDVSNVTDMGWMFSNANSFNQDIENWDVSNVTTVEMLFGDTRSGMKLMFQDTTSLEKIPSWYKE